MNHPPNQENSPAMNTTAPPAPATATDSGMPLIMFTGRTDEDWRREMAEFRAWRAAQPDIAEWDRDCRARDAIAAERHDAEVAEQRRLVLAGLAPLTGDGTWETHLLWLSREFGAREFSTSDVRQAALTPDGWVAPPGSWDPLHPGTGKQLGLAYGRVAQRDYGGLYLVRGGLSNGSRRWSVRVKEGHQAACA